MSDGRFDLKLRDLGVTMRPAPYVHGQDGEAVEATWIATLPLDITGHATATVEYTRYRRGSELEDEGGAFTIAAGAVTVRGEWCGDFDAAWNSLLDEIDVWSPVLALQIRRLEWAWAEREKRAFLNGETLTEEEEANL